MEDGRTRAETRRKYGVCRLGVRYWGREGRGGEGGVRPHASKTVAAQRATYPGDLSLVAARGGGGRHLTQVAGEGAIGTLQGRLAEPLGDVHTASGASGGGVVVAAAGPLTGSHVPAVQATEGRGRKTNNNKTQLIVISHLHQHCEWLRQERSQKGSHHPHHNIFKKKTKPTSALSSARGAGMGRWVRGAQARTRCLWRGRLRSGPPSSVWRRRS
jgi:hypothetical protein